MWPQPLDPLHSVELSALVAATPLAIVLILMGVFRKSALLASTCGLLTAGTLAVLVWRMPLSLVLWSGVYGFAYAVWPILWIVFTALWLYNLSVETGSFDQLRRWMTQQASGDPCIQAVLVAFCFGALLESCAGAGAPIAVTAFLLVALGFNNRQAVVVALIANTAPVAFAGMGLPILALAGVTELDASKLSAMVGRQLPFLSLILPSYLVWVVGGGGGLKRTWPVALVAGSTYALAQFSVSNLWGPYAADIVSALVSIGAVVAFLRAWTPGISHESRWAKAGTSLVVADTEEQVPLPPGVAFTAWLPWIVLSVVMIFWSLLKLFQWGQMIIPVPSLHQGILITLYQKPYSALYTFEPLAVGTAVLTAIVLTGLCLGVQPWLLRQSAARSFHQLGLSGFTVITIVGLAYLYNYSGMVYTLGAAAARLGSGFPFASAYLGWVGCFLSGSDAASNILFGNLQVAAAHQLHLNPVLLAATNSSGGVVGKMISPQNIAVGVSTVGLIGQEGKVLHSIFWHSFLLITLLSVLAYSQAYWIPWMVP
jgi:lactate permease